MRVYTKTGDNGTTGLLGGRRIAKTSLRIHAIGEVDELNSALGMARLHSAGTQLDVLLQTVQNRLFDLGAEIASPPEGTKQGNSISAKDVQMLEASMDEQTAALPALRNFILPGGSPLAAHLHHARAVCRRAERTFLALDDVEPVRHETRVYLNRLSDWLFVSSRTANAAEGVLDIAWEKSEE